MRAVAGRLGGQAMVMDTAVGTRLTHCAPDAGDVFPTASCHAHRHTLKIFA